jgi:hypothetical protein
MTRGLKRRVDAVWEAIGGDTDAVLAALDVIRRIGKAPDGAAGARAAWVCFRPPTLFLLRSPPGLFHAGWYQLAPVNPHTCF